MGILHLSICLIVTHHVPLTWELDVALNAKEGVAGKFLISGIVNTMKHFGRIVNSIKRSVRLHRHDITRVRYFLYN